MVEEFKMPSLGADMESGKIVAWHVKPGDHVNRGDIIAEVETQKGIIEVEVWHTGTFREALVGVDREVPVGTVLALIDGESSAPEPALSEASPSREELSSRTLHDIAKSVALNDRDVSAPKILNIGPPRSRRLRASPLARKMAAAKNIDLALIHGSGPHGTITRKDVEDYYDQAPSKTVPHHVAAKHEKTSAMRAAIASSMSRSKREIPHYYLQTEVNMETCLAALDKLNTEKPITKRVLPAALYAKAVALACMKVPEMNGFWIEGEFHAASSVHTGMGISLRQGGLVAPAIHDVNTKSVDTIMADLLDLVSRARSGKLRGSEISDPTITITSLGDQGVETVFGVIYPPQVAIVGFGTVTPKPWAADGMVGVKPIVTVTLSADHRASDGHRGGLFLNHIKKHLADPTSLGMGL